MNLRIWLLAFSLLTLFDCRGQEQKPTDKATSVDERTVVGGAFENRDYLYQGMPDQIAATDTSPGWRQNGQALLITGTIYKPDGRTPAPGVVLYYYHTNTDGRYVHKPGESRTMPPNALGQTHGYIRGWVKSDKDGRYAIYTVRPGVYPTHDEPAHIHATIKEPAINTPYYIDEFVFDDDPLLTTAKRKKLENRGGTGVLRVLLDGKMQVAEHDIVLGLNIPNYPQSSSLAIESGLSIGEEQPSFTPFHAYGPDQGSRACPVCKYGRYEGVIYFVGNNTNWDDVKKWLTFLEAESVRRGKWLKVYFVYGNPVNYSKENRQRELEQLGHQLNVKNSALTFVPSFSDVSSEVYLNRINPDVQNTFVLFRQRVIVDTFISLKPTPQSFKQITDALDAKKGAFLELNEPEHR